MRSGPFLLSVAVFLFVACTNNPSGENSSDKTKVKVPALDLHAAVFMGDLKTVRQHILFGTDLNTKDDYGSTPLISASLFGKTGIALALIEGGADVNRTNAEGSTALHTASFFCRPEIVKALLDKGADKEVRNKYGSTALESVAGPFSEVKGIYDQLGKDLGPLGLKLDYEYIEATRPVIAGMLQE